MHVDIPGEVCGNKNKTSRLAKQRNKCWLHAEQLESKRMMHLIGRLMSMSSCVFFFSSFNCFSTLSFGTGGTFSIVHHFPTATSQPNFWLASAKDLSGKTTACVNIMHQFDG